MTSQQYDCDVCRFGLYCAYVLVLVRTGVTVLVAVRVHHRQKVDGKLIQDVLRFRGVAGEFPEQVWHHSRSDPFTGVDTWKKTVYYSSVAADPVWVWYVALFSVSCDSFRLLCHCIFIYLFLGQYSYIYEKAVTYFCSHIAKQQLQSTDFS